MLGLLGLRIFEAYGAGIADLGEEHGHRVLRVCGKGGKGGKVVLVPLPPAVARAIDRAVDGRTDGPILRNTLGDPVDVEQESGSWGIGPGRVHGFSVGEGVLVAVVSPPRWWCRKSAAASAACVTYGSVS